MKALIWIYPEYSTSEEIEPEYSEPAAESAQNDIFKQDEDEFPDMDFTGLDEKKNKPEPQIKSDMDELSGTDISSDLDKIHELLGEENANDFSLEMEEEPEPPVKPCSKR